MTTESQTPQTYQFADLTVDIGRRTVFRRGRSVDLPGKSFDFLVALVRAAPNLLSHSDLVEQVWGGRIVTSDTVTQRAKLLRDALGDNAKNPRYILVARGQGYRLIPEVVFPVAISTPVRRPRLIGVAASFAALTLFAFLSIKAFSWLSPGGAPPELARSEASVAVLPFADLSEDGQQSNFVDALHIELLTYLAKIDGLKVISRNSVLGYRDESTSVPDIGVQLGVESVLRGSVQRTGDTVRINVQLVDADRDDHLWTEIYERDFSAENMLSIQSEMAQAIAGALRVELSTEEITHLSSLPTTNTIAYEAYLAGTTYLRSLNDFFGGRPGAELATMFFERAVDADSQFGLAWAALARSHAAMFFFEFDPSEKRLEMAERAIERARLLAPDEPETQVAIGQYFYHGLRDYETALEQFTMAEQRMPGASALYATKAFIHRRRGDFSGAVADMQRAIILDPRNEELLNQQGLNYEFRRDYVNAKKIYDRFDHTWPDIGPRAQESHYAWLAVRSDGDVTGIKRFAEDSAEHDERWFYEGWLAALYERDFSRALEYLSDWEAEAVDWALNRYVSKDALYAATARLAGDNVTAQVHYRAAQSQLRPLLDVSPDVPRLRVAIGEVLAGLGDRDGALQMASDALELMPASRDALNAPRIRLDVILRVLIPAGEYGAAIEQLNEYLSQPGQWSIEGLLPDPRLDAIRNEPHFLTLVAEHARPK